MLLLLLVLQVDVILDDTLPRMLQWGLLQQHDNNMYSITPLHEAVANLQQYWFSSTQQQQQQFGQNGRYGRAEPQQQAPTGAGRHISSSARAAVPAATATAAVSYRVGRNALDASTTPHTQLHSRRLYQQKLQRPAVRSLSARGHISSAVRRSWGTGCGRI